MSNKRAKHGQKRPSILGRVVRGLSAATRLRTTAGGTSQPAASPRRRSFSLEVMEPRLLLSADLSYGALSGVHDFTLRAKNAAGVVSLNLFDTTALSTALASVQFNAVGDLDVTVSRGGGAVVQSLNGDTLRVDLDTFSVLNSFVGSHGHTLSIGFAGGLDTGTANDLMKVDGAAASFAYNLSLKSSSDVTVDAHASVSGDLTVLSEALTTGGLVPSTGLLANANAGVSLVGAQLASTGTLTLQAHGNVVVTTDGTAISGVTGAAVTSFSTATVDVSGSTVSAKTLVLTSLIDGSLTATAANNTVKLVTVIGKADPRVVVHGASTLSATQTLTLTAKSDVTINASTSPAANADAKVDAAVVNTTFASGAAVSVGDSSHLSATGAAVVQASSKLAATTKADGNVANTAGAAVAVSVVTGDTTATISAATVTGSSVSVTASSDRTVTTTANASPGGSKASSDGSNKSEKALSDNDASTSDGQVKVAGAIAIGTDTGTTSASLQGATVAAGAGVAKVTASDADVMTLTADGHFTGPSATGIGVGVAIGVVGRSNLAFVSGATDVTASKLQVQVLAPAPSRFAASATSGAGAASSVGIAGSIAMDVIVTQNRAYVDAAATLTLHGGTDLTVSAISNVTSTVTAVPADGGGDPTKVGIGASLAYNYDEDATSGEIRDGVALTGAHGLALGADSTHAMLTTARNGGAGGTAVTPVVAISIADDDVGATIGSGGLLGIGGDLGATAALRDVVVTTATGDTKSSSTGVGISVALSVVNDHALSTTARDLAAGGAAAFVSSAVSGSQSTAKASVSGGEPDDKSDDHDGAGKQSVDNKAGDQKNFADGKATEKNGAAKGTEGAKTPSASTSDGSVSVAGAVAVNIGNGSSQALIGTGRSVTSTGALGVTSAANVDGTALADGSAVQGVYGFNPTSRVDVAADTIDLGTATRLKAGDKVTYSHGDGGGDIGGLVTGTDYFVYDTGGGKFQFYDTAAHANAHGTTGRVDLTSKGSGFKHAFKGAGAGGTSVGAAVAVNSAHATNLATIAGVTIHAGGVNLAATEAERALGFSPATKVNTTNDTIDAGTSGLRSGDRVVYRNGGGTDVGGLKTGQGYFVSVQDDGKLKLYTSREAAIAGGTAGLVDLTSTGAGAAHVLVDATDGFGAQAISGAGGGDTGVAGSVAINLAFTDTEAALGVGVAVPTVTVTGNGDVALTAGIDVTNFAVAVPSNGGGDGTKVGIGISVAIDDGENTTFARIIDGTSLSGARGLTLSATTSQLIHTEARSGGKGSTAVTPVVAVAIADDDTAASLGAGAAVSLTGSFGAQAALSDAVQTSAAGDTISDDTGVGISVAVSVVNDHASASIGRDLSGAAVTVSSSDVTTTESVASASVKGGEQDDGSGSHDGANSQSVDNTTNKQTALGDGKAKQADANAKGAEGASNDKASTSDGTVSVAGAVAVNLVTGSSQASVGNGRKVTATSLLSVASLSNVDGHALATGAASTNGSGVGVGVAVSIDVAHATNLATIGSGAVVSGQGLTVTAGMAARTVAMDSATRPIVDITSDSIFLGAGDPLKTGDKVTYDAGGGTAIGGLTSGNTYFVAVQAGGSVRLYDTAAHAAAGAAAGRADLTSVGAGTGHKLKRGLLQSDVSFDPATTVRLLDLGTQSGLHTGDAVRYAAGGGAAMGGIADGTTYFVIELAGGKFQLAASVADARAGKAIVLGSGGNPAQSLVDVSHSFRVEATSGGGGGKVGIAGAVAVNVVTDDTEAVVGSGGAASVTVTGGGNVTVATASDQSNVARALPSDGGGKGSSVGVGASVAINDIDNTVQASVTDGTGWAGTGGAFAVTASSGDSALTHGENGASGGSVAVGVGAAVAVVHDTVGAYVGTGSAIAATGPISVTASHSGAFDTTTSAEAAAGSVGVGASVSVAVITQDVAAQLARSISTTLGAASIASTSTVAVTTTATASAKGEDKNDSSANSGGKSGADGQANHEVNDNSTTSGQSLTSASDSSSSAQGSGSSESGEGGSGVGIAAAVAVNAVTTHTTAHVGNGADLTAPGAITVLAQAQVDASAKAVGSALGLDNNVNVAAGVGLNVVHATDTAFVDSGSILTGGGISIRAVTPSGQTDDFVAWGAAAGGGKGDVAVAGSVGINVISLDTEAVARSGSAVVSTGGLTVASRADVRPQTLAAAASFSQGTAVGAAVAIALVDVTSIASLAGKADAAGAILVDAELHVDVSKIDVPLLPDSADPSATSIAVAGGASSGDVGVAGAVVIDIFHLKADASLGAGAAVNQSGVFAPSTLQSLTVQAVDPTVVTSIAGGLGVTTGSAGVGGSLDVELITKDTHAHIDRGAIVSVGGAASLLATGGDTLISVVGTVGVADTAGIAGSVAVQVVTTRTDAYLADAPTGAQTQLKAGGAVQVSAVDAFKTTMIAGSVGAAGTAGIGAANTTLVHSATVAAYLGTRAVLVAGDTGVAISAQAGEDVLSIAAGIAVGGTAGVAGSAAVNVLNEATTAYVGRSATVTADNGAAPGRPSLSVTAADATSVISVAGSIAVGGTAGVGVGADVGTYAKSTTAYIDSGVVADVEGDITVAANSSESLVSVAGGVGVGTVGVAVDAGVHVFNLTTLAFIGDNPADAVASAGAGNVHAGGSVVVAAHDLGDINEIVGVIAAGEVGIGAAAGVNIINKTTDAFIGSGASVTGDGNGPGLLVDTGGITTGFGASVGTYDPGNPTGQGIETNDGSTLTNAASGDRSAFRAAGHVDTPNLGKMDLTNSGTKQSLADNSLTGERSTQLGTQSGFTGVAVTADNRDEIRTFTVSLAGGVVGVAVSAGVDVVHAHTEARIDNGAQVNASLAAAAGGQSVLVGAGDDFYHLAVAATLGVGAVGVAPAVGVNVVGNTTLARIGTSAKVNALGGVAVEAGAQENVVMVGIGIAAGAVGVGAVVDVLTIADQTTALIAGTVAAGGDVVVVAADDTHVFELSGALGVGFVGVGGAVGVMTIDKTTIASIGAAAHVDALGNGGGTSGILDGSVFLDHFGTTIGHGVVVQAASSQDLTHIVATGAAGFVGVSGAVGVTLIGGQTDATIAAGAVVDQASPASASAAQDVVVDAADGTTIRTYMIGIAGGFVGVAGAVDVGTLDENVDAEIAAGAVVGARHDVQVRGLGHKDLQGFVASAAGGFVGVGGAVSVWSVGTQVQKTYADNDGHSASGVDGNNGHGAADDNAGQQSQSGAGLVTGQLGGFGGDGNSHSNRSRVGSTTASADASIAAGAPTQAGIAARENAAPVPPGITGAIRGGAHVTAGHDVGVNGTERSNFAEIAGQFAGGVVGAGASVAILSIADNVAALGDGILTAGNNVQVRSSLNENVSVTALDGSVGFVGLGAAVVVITDTGVVQSTLGTVNSAQAVSLTAGSSRIFHETTGQISAGAVGAGASFTKLSIGGGAFATVDVNASIGKLSPVASLVVGAVATVTADVTTVAVTAGIGAFSANFALLDVTPKIEAAIGDHAKINASGSVFVIAEALLDDTADTTGVSAGGLAVGVSLTKITTAPVVIAAVGNPDDVTKGSVQISAAALTVLGATVLPASGYTAQADASGSVGALIGVTSTNTAVFNTSTVRSFVANGAQLAIVGATAITALGATRQKASSDSNAGGLIAAGISTASASSSTDTEAFFGANVSLVGASLAINANGADDDFAGANAGSGGLIAGAAEIAHTKNLSVTHASIGNGASGHVDVNRGAGSFAIHAEHTATFNAQITAVAGGLFAGTGADIDNTVSADTAASVGNDVYVLAKSISMLATDHASKPWLSSENIKGTTGGLASGAGGSDHTTISFTTQVLVGDRAHLEVPGIANGDHDFMLAALNDFAVYDKVAFETGGAVSGAQTNASIKALVDVARVQVGVNAVLLSSGAIDMSARGQGELIEDVLADTYGLGTVTTGESDVEVTPTNDVTIGAGTVMTAYGDLDLTSGTDTTLDSDQYHLEARYDAFAGSLVPISDLDAYGYLVQTNRVTIGVGAHLSTARQANLDAARLGIADITAKAKAVSWASDIADAILSLTGGGGVEQYNGELLAEAHGSVRNDGTVETGITRQQHLTLTGWDKATGTITVYDASAGVTFTTSQKSISSSLVDELNFDQKQLQNYGASNPTLKAFYQGEIARITDELSQQGLIEFQDNGDGTTTAIAVSQYVMTVTVDPIFADAGAIDVRADQLFGSGKWIAPSDASVTITNATPAYLEILGITIPEDTGGLYFNGVKVGDNTLITSMDVTNAATDNQFNASTGIDGIVTAVASTFVFGDLGGNGAPAPVVDIENTLDVVAVNANQGTNYTWPDIIVLGPASGGIGIHNLQGDVILKTVTPSNPTSKGDIKIFGQVEAKNLTVVAGGDVFIEGVSAYEVGGSPAAQWGAATTGTYGAGGTTAPGVVAASAAGIANTLAQQPSGINLYGDRVHISADFINVNGLIQSGKADETLVLGAAAQTAIQQIINSGATGVVRLVGVSTGDYDVFFDTATQRIEVEDLRVGGGYIDLVGHIVNTANGAINVLGGYGNITVVNNTTFDLGIHRLDASQRGAGTLIITDTAKGTVAKPYVTLYQETAGGLTITRDSGSGPVVTNNAPLDSAYTPGSFWRYGWTVGVTEQEIKTKTITSSNWLGLIELGKDIQDWDTIEVAGTPRLVGAGPYYYQDVGNSSAYEFARTTNVLSDTGAKEIYHHSDSTWYGEHTYTATFQDVTGQEVFDTHDISASRNIGIHFIGGTEANVSVTSSAAVYIEGAILNPTGTTTITAGTTIAVAGPAGLVGGRRVVLSAVDGIGSDAIGLRTNVTQTVFASLAAFTTRGEIHIDQVVGVLPVDQIISYDQSPILLTSPGGISVAQLSKGVFAQGLVAGGNVTLLAGSGGIGNDTVHPLEVRMGTGPKRDGLGLGHLTATATTNVFVIDRSGNMLVNKVTTAGDVWLSVPNGSLIDDNKVAEHDDRTYAELKAGVWSDLQLTAAGGYDQKVADTLASYVTAREQEYATYWQFRRAQPNHGVSYDPSYTVTLTAAEDAYYRGTLGYTQAQIDAFVETRTTEYHALNAAYGGFGNTYNPGFTYVVSASEHDALVGGIKEWSEDQLLSLLSAGLLKTVTSTVVSIEDPNVVARNVTFLTGGSVGQSNGQVTIDVTTKPVHFTDQQLAVLAAAERLDVQYLGGTTSSATVNFDAASNTIRRLDGGSWIADGLKVGMTLTVAGNGQYLQNATTTNVFYKIVALSGTVITVDTATPLATELNVHVNVTPLVLDPVFQALAPASAATVQFQAASLNGAATMTRSDGGSFVADGFQVGQKLRISGSTGNSTTGSEVFTIAAVTAKTITFADNDAIVDAATDQAVQLTRGTTPVVTALQVAQVDDVNVTATGIIDITAGRDVLLGSTVDIRIDRVTAGDTTTGDAIRIKGSKNVFSASVENVNLRGADVILEAATGSIGQRAGQTQAPVTLDSIAGGTLTARAFGVVVISERAQSGTGIMNVESVYSATSDAYLSADSYILDALNTDFTKVKAAHIDLISRRAGIGLGGDTINYLDLDASGTVTATALSSIYLSETTGDMRIDHIDSLRGDVDLRANRSLLDAASKAYDSSGRPDLPGTDVFGRNVRLTATTGSIGVSANPLDFLLTQQGALTARALLDIYAIDTTGDMIVNSAIAGAGTRSVFLTATTGSIFDGLPTGAPKVQAAYASLVARDGIGTSSDHLVTKVAKLETKSGAQGTWIDNLGPLTLGNETSAGTITITSSSPITVTQSLIAGGSLILTAIDDNRDGKNPATDDVPDSIVVNAKDASGRAVTIQAYADLQLQAGDDLTVQSGATLQAGGLLALWCDYQVPSPTGAPGIDPDPGRGGTVDMAGVLMAPLVEVLGGADADTINLTGRMTGAYPWIAATYPATFTRAFGLPFPTEHSNGSLVGIAGQGGNDRITLAGSTTAATIAILGGDGDDVISLNPAGTPGHDAVIAGHVIIQGNAGSDQILVHRLNSLDTADKFVSGGSGPGGLVTGRGTSPRATLDIDGGVGADKVRIDLTGTTDDIINVTDSGNVEDGADTLSLVGTGGDDTFLVRQDFVAMLQPTGQNYERVNLDSSIDALDIDAGAGNDRFFVSANDTATTLHGGSGNDSFQFGQLYGEAPVSPKDVAAGDEVGTNATTRGALSLGASVRTTAYGGDGDDSFSVYGNSTVLTLLGENGNDSLLVRSFALAGSAPTAPGYVVQGFVAFDGGANTNTATVLGTEDNDSLSIDAKGVSGAGLQVGLAHLRTLEVDALGGDDTLSVPGTASGVLTTLIGGDGSDTFGIGGIDIDISKTPQPHLTSLIDGPVVIEGDSLPRDRSLHAAQRLPSEADVALPAAPPAGDATPQTDTLEVFNDESATNDVGTLGPALQASGLGEIYGVAPAAVKLSDFGHISGLSLAPGATIDYGTAAAPDKRVFDDGIVFHRMEVADILLGHGNDMFTVRATPPGTITTVQGGGGSDKIVATGGGGSASPLILFGDTSQDGSFYDGGPGHAHVFANAGNDTIDASADISAVVIYGGAGDDTLLGGGGGDWIAGGSGKDTIRAGGGVDIVFGDDGFNLDLSKRLSLSNQVLLVANQWFESEGAASDQLAAAPDDIDGGTGANILIGDHGIVTQDGIDGILSTGHVLAVETTRSFDGAGDRMVSGGGGVILGGFGSDTITSTSSANNVVAGDEARVVYSKPGVLASVSSIDGDYSSPDTIKLGAGNDIIASEGTDKLDAGGGTNIVVPSYSTYTVPGARAAAQSRLIDWTVAPASSAPASSAPASSAPASSAPASSAPASSAPASSAPASSAPASSAPASSAPASSAPASSAPASSAPASSAPASSAPASSAPASSAPASNAAPTTTAAQPATVAAGSDGWLDDFVTRLARPSIAHGPNAAIRVRVPA